MGPANSQPSEVSTVASRSELSKVPGTSVDDGHPDALVMLGRFPST
jgi:hypothetical protein